MPVTLTSITSDAEPSRPPRRSRRPFRDNPRLILAGIGVLVIVLAGILAYANRSTGLTPDYLAEFVLYALIAADLTMVVALVFVLARNIVKLVLERRRGRPFARFRANLVALLIGMTLVPAMLVLAVGSEPIRTSVGVGSTCRWMRSSSGKDRRRLLPGAPTACRIEPPGAAVGGRPRATTTTPLREAILPEVSPSRVQVVQVYRASPTRLLPLWFRSWMSPQQNALAIFARGSRPSGRAGGGRPDETRAVETFGTSGDLLHAASVVRGATGKSAESPWRPTSWKRGPHTSRA